MRINLPYTIILTLMGIVSGTISGWFTIANNQLGFTSPPGFIFGIALALLWLYDYISSQERFVLIKALGIVVVSTIGYLIAYYVTFYGVMWLSIPADVFNSEPLLNIFIASPIMAAVGGFCGTFVVALYLTVITHGASVRAVKLAAWGAVIAAVLIDAFILSIGDGNMLGSEGVFIFFIGWQAIMLAKLGHLISPVARENLVTQPTQMQTAVEPSAP